MEEGGPKSHNFEHPPVLWFLPHCPLPSLHEVNSFHVCILPPPCSSFSLLGIYLNFSRLGGHQVRPLPHNQQLRKKQKDWNYMTLITGQKNRIVPQSYISLWGEICLAKLPGISVIGNYLSLAAWVLNSAYCVAGNFLNKTNKQTKNKDISLPSPVRINPNVLPTTWMLRTKPFR